MTKRPAPSRPFPSAVAFEPMSVCASRNAVWRPQSEQGFEMALAYRFAPPSRIPFPHAHLRTCVREFSAKIHASLCRCYGSVMRRTAKCILAALFVLANKQCRKALSCA